MTILGVTYEAVRNGTQSLTDAQIENLFELCLSEAVAYSRQKIPGFDNMNFAQQFVVVEALFTLVRKEFDEFEELKKRHVQAQKIFGVGLSRTGTTSLNRALQILGINSMHFPCDKTTRQELYEFFARQSQGMPIAPSISLSALNYCDAITDTPACCIYKSLDVVYPNVKFILTIRDKTSWLNSREAF